MIWVQPIRKMRLTITAYPRRPRAELVRAADQGSRGKTSQPRKCPVQEVERSHVRRKRTECGAGDCGVPVHLRCIAGGAGRRLLAAGATLRGPPDSSATKSANGRL